MHPEYMGQQYPYPMPPGPPVSFQTQGIMQPPLSAIPRGGSAGSMQNGVPTNGETDSSTSEREPPKKRRKRSQDDSPEASTVEGVGAESSVQRGTKREASPRGGADASLNASLILDADEAATVVALLKQASGHSTSPDTSPDPPPPEQLSQEIPPNIHPATTSPVETSVPGTTSFVDDSDADADADADSEVDADGEADLELPAGSYDGAHHHNFHHSPLRPPPLGHLLTEDGEPMLNPAEILTQESLASPPQA